MSAAARRSTARKHRCVSADGTPLTVRRVGAGPPLVMVHGTCGRLHDFRALESYLHQTHEVWSFDRRGRGDSGDTEPYALEREVEDLVAVLDAAGPGAHLFGHSFGGLIALLAAPRVVSLRSLMVYEPAVRGDRFDLATVELATERVAAGDLGGAIDAFFCGAGITPDEAAAIRSSKAAWGGMLKSVGTQPRESAALITMGWDPTRFRPIGVPTVMIRGADTEAAVFADDADMRRLAPHAEVRSLPGQGHLAFIFEPEAFAEVLLEFIGTT